MSEYADLVMYSTLLPIWGHIPFSAVERALEEVHIKQHNIPHAVEWWLGPGSVWEANCGPKITAVTLMRRLGANRN